MSKRTKRLTLAALALLLLCAGVFYFWQSGFFYRIGDFPSPDGVYCATVYDRKLDSEGISDFGPEPGASIILTTTADRDISWRTTYGRSTFLGLHWSPDSTRYILALRSADGTPHLLLDRMDPSTTSNLTAYLDTAVANAGLADTSEIYYEFLAWSPDGAALHIQYTTPDTTGDFWYQPAEGIVPAPAS